MSGAATHDHGAPGGRAALPGACPGHEHPRDHHHGAGAARPKPGSHDHSRHSRHGHGARDRRRLLLALALTLTICVVEVIGGYYSGSRSLLGDAQHMLSDVLGEVLALIGLAWAVRPADTRRTFGYQRVEILMALLQGAVLFTMATGVIWSAAHRLLQPPEIRTGLMLGVALVGLLANLASASLLHGSHNLNVRGAYLHVLMDLLSSVAVLLTGAVMWLSRGLYALDAITAIGIGLFIYYSAYRLAVDAVDVLLLAVPRGLDLSEVSTALRALTGVVDVHDLHLFALASERAVLTAHLVVPADAGAPEREALLRRGQALLAERFGIAHATLQIEADRCQYGC